MIKFCPNCRSQRLIKGDKGVKCKKCGYVNLKRVEKWV